MRQGSVIAEGSIDGFQALGAFGQPVHQSYVQLRAAIEQRLGQRHADFFARPQIDDRAKRIRWVAPIPGEAVNWRDLSREQQAERALDLQIMRGEFDGYLKELVATRGQSPERSGGEAFAAVLQQALRTPNDGHLHFIGDQPIATFWGFSEPGSPGFEPLGAAPRAEATPVVPPLAAEPAAGEPVALVEQRRGWPRWLWALLLLLLLLLILLPLLFWPSFPRLLGLDLPFIVETPREEVPVPIDEPPVQRLPDGRVIERDGVLLDGERGVVVPDGGTVQAPPGEGGLPVAPEGGLVEPVPPAPGEEPTTQGSEPPTPDAGAEPPGDETEPTPPEPPPATPPDGQPTEPPAEPEGQQPPDPGGPDTGALPDPGGGAPLAIPDGAVGDSGPADFLQGRWRSRSGLVDEASGAPVDLSYQFDKAGRGRAVVRRADGVECSAPAEARMENSELRMRELEDLRCADGQVFEKSETACERDAQGQTRCRGVYEGGKKFDVQIDRAAP